MISSMRRSRAFVSFFWLLLLPSCSEDSITLRTCSDDAEANRVMQHLMHAGFHDAKKVEVKQGSRTAWKITVPEGSQAGAYECLMGIGDREPEELETPSGLSSIHPARELERLHVLRQCKADLRAGLLGIPGIVDASILVSFDATGPKEERGFTVKRIARPEEDKELRSASVTIHHMGSEGEAPVTREKVVEMVMSQWPRIAEDRIQVQFFPEPSVDPKKAPLSAASSLDPLFFWAAAGFASLSILFFGLWLNASSRLKKKA